MWLNKFGIYIIICFAFLLRLISLNQSLWWDEVINVHFAKTLPFWNYIRYYTVSDFHPPGYFVILWIWGHLFGWTEIAVRMPSVILGIGTVYLTFLIGKDLFSKKVGLLAALMLSLAPLHIYYSQEARMYSFAAFAATLSMYCFIGLIKEFKYSLVGYSLSVILVLYSDYVAYFILIPQIIYIIFFQRERIKSFITCLLVGVLPALLFLPIFYEQVQVGMVRSSSLLGWRHAVGGTGVKDVTLLFIKTLVGKVSFDNKVFYAGLLTVMSIPYLILSLKLRKLLKGSAVLIILWTLIPPVVALLISFYIPVFNYSRFIYLLPAFYLIFASLLCYYKKPISKLLIMAVLIPEIVMSGLYLFNTDFQREDWRTAIMFVQQNLHSDDTILFEYDNVPAPYTFYSDNLINVKAGLVATPARSKDYLSDLQNTLKQKRRVFLFEYLVDITDPDRLIEVKLSELGFIQKGIYNFRGLGFIRLYEINNER